MQATLQLSPARLIIREAEACLQRLKKALDSLEAAESVKPVPWDEQDDMALMRLADDGNPNCE